MQISRTLTSACVAAGVLWPVTAGDPGDTSFNDEVHKYLTRYAASYQRLNVDWQEVLWNARADATSGAEADRGAARAQRIAAETALTAFTGSTENIGLSRTYLEHEKELSPVNRRELARILFLATGSPGIVPDLVEKRIADDAAAEALLHDFEYTLRGRPGSLEEIERVLRDDRDLAQRREAWEAAHAVGRALRPLLVRLRWLRNESVRALGQRDFLAYRASEYGFSTNELTRRCEDIVRELRPLQAELHTWLRFELARRYAQPVPDLIPAHWLPDPTGSDWSALVDTPFPGLDVELARATPRDLVERAQRFYASLGFGPLPASFWDRSVLSAWDVSGLAPASGRVLLEGRSRATVWHVDLDLDVRARLVLEPGVHGWAAALGALGGVHCAIAHSNPNVPIVLRTGANRALHEAVGSMMTIAAAQPRCLRSAGFGAVAAVPETLRVLLAHALRYAEAIPASAGTQLQFEAEIYRGELPPERWNARWWQLAAKYQGLAAPSPRDERWCDPASQRGIVTEPAQGYDRALAYVLCFQLHDHVARKILDCDPHDTDYWGRREVGDFVRSIVRFGATVDWRTKLREKTGLELSTRPMVEYFEPLRLWLAEQNKGRTSTLPAL